MVKHTQTIRRQKQKLTNCLSVFDHFEGLALKGLKISVFEVLPGSPFPEGVYNGSKSSISVQVGENEDQKSIRIGQFS